MLFCLQTPYITSNAAPCTSVSWHSNDTVKSPSCLPSYYASSWLFWHDKIHSNFHNRLAYRTPSLYVQYCDTYGINSADSVIILFILTRKDWTLFLKHTETLWLNLTELKIGKFIKMIKVYKTEDENMIEEAIKSFVILQLKMKSWKVKVSILCENLNLRVLYSNRFWLVNYFK